MASVDQHGASDGVCVGTAERDLTHTHTKRKYQATKRRESKVDEEEEEQGREREGGKNSLGGKERTLTTFR